MTNEHRELVIAENFFKNLAMKTLCAPVGPRGFGLSEDDLSAKVITSELQYYGINYVNCDVHESGITPTSYITLNRKNGSRTIVHYRDLPELPATSFEKVSLDGINWIHFEGRNPAETAEMLSRVSRMGKNIPVSVEIEKQREGLEALFKGGDIYFFSKAFATGDGKSKSFSNAHDFLIHYRELIPDAILICTWGSEGAYALEGNQLHFSPALRVSSAVDTIGAGDTFIAGFIHASLSNEKHGDSLQSKLDYACALAAKKCAIKGFKDLL